VLGFSSAIAPMAGFSYDELRHGDFAVRRPGYALYLFIVFYLSCIALTWWYYARRNAEMPC